MSIQFKVKKINVFILALRWIYGSALKNIMKVSTLPGPKEEVLIYFEGCKNKVDANKREKYLKTGMGKRYIKNRLRRFLALTG